MTPNQQLIDQILALKAQLAGKRMELAMAHGKRSVAHQHRRVMQRAVIARRQMRIAAETHDGGCYFSAAGEADRVTKGMTA